MTRPSFIIGGNIVISNPGDFRNVICINCSILLSLEVVGMSVLGNLVHEDSYGNVITSSNPESGMDDVGKTRVSIDKRY